MNQDFKTQWEDLYPKVYGYFFRRVDLREDVEDLVSETMADFYTAFAHRKDLQILEIQRYVWGIARNKIKNFFKEKKNKPGCFELMDEDHFPKSLEEDYLEIYRSSHFKKFYQKLQECIQRFSKKEEVKILDLRFIQEKNSTEISKILKIKATTVRQRVSRLLSKLKKRCIDIWEKFGKF